MDFRVLTKEYGRRIYWHIRRIVVSHDDAEDALQETFVKIYTKLDTFRGENDILAWIYRIATNEALQVLRRRTKIFQSIDSLSDTLSQMLDGETDYPSNSPEVLLQKALLKLPHTQRIVFNMRYFDELTYEQIATATGKSVATLKTNYHYAVEKIKQYITDKTIL